ncbi:MAG: ABC transporter permease subunit, partial [Alphaproteobacteria bacterium]|nr:ABC transporter permease subunit [Alphaproteobacteria bacterium]
MHPKLLQFGGLLIVFAFLCFAIDPSDTNALWRLPAYMAAVPIWLSNSVEFLMYEWLPIDIYNTEIEEYEESALLKITTRSISGIILFCIEFIREILLGGVKTIVTFTSWDYVRENSWAYWPALPWTVVSGAAIVLGYSLGGRWLSILVGFSTIYIAVFGQWEPAMETLSFVLVAAPLSVFLGLSFGVWAYKSRAVEAALMPLLNVAQTMPHFSYLVPVTVFFGVGDHAGAIATVIFATPPMIRLTLLGLKSVAPEVIDAGMMNG